MPETSLKEMRFHHVIVVVSLALACALALGHTRVRPAEPTPAMDNPCSGSQTNAGCMSLTEAQERELKPNDAFRECEDCPEMVVVPAGSFTMGSPAGEKDRSSDEGPQHIVTISKSFAVGRFHVTRDQFAAFVRETGYQASSCHKWTTWDGSWRDPGFAQEASHPVVCVSWNDAMAYAAWVARKTGKPYRLLSEAEWEYAARGRTSPGAYPRFWFGDDEGELCHKGNSWRGCDEYQYTAPVGHYPANAFGLYDMAGNAWQWTADCYHDSYDGAPADGSVWATGACGPPVERGGSWGNSAMQLRAAHRVGYPAASNSIGFRLARTL
jgi:formylglycine-generating enzyme required for sulfatase activity